MILSNSLFSLQMVGIEVQKRNNERPSSILKGGKLRRENKGKEGHQGEDQVAKHEITRPLKIKMD